MKNLTQKQIDKIQLNEGEVYLDFGEETERYLAPTRGGGELTITTTLRDIEFDGRRGKTKGLQAVEEEAAVLKVTVLDLSQENLKLAIPGCTVTGTAETGIKISNSQTIVIDASNYNNNITMFTKLLGGGYKKITLFNPMHEGALTIKAAPKAEGELALEINAHFNPFDDTEHLYDIEEVTEIIGLANIPAIENE